MADRHRPSDLHGELRRLGYLEARVDRFLDDARSPIACGARTGLLVGPPIAIVIALHHVAADPTLLAERGLLALEFAALSLCAVLGLGLLSAAAVSLARRASSRGPGVRLAILALPTLLVAGHLVATLVHLSATFPTGASGVARAIGFGAITLAATVFVGRTTLALARSMPVRSGGRRARRRHLTWAIARASAMGGLIALAISLVLPDRPARPASAFEPRPTGEHVVWIHIEGLAGRVLEEVRTRNSMPNLLRRLQTSATYPVPLDTHLPPSTLWTTLATGTPADRHGIHRFAQVGVASGRPENPSLGELFRRTRELCFPFTLPLRTAPVSALERRVPTLAEIVSERGYRTIVLNGWCTGPVGGTREFIVSDRAFRLAIIPKDAGTSPPDFSRLVETEVAPAEIRGAIAARLEQLSRRPDAIDAFDSTVLALAGDLVLEYADPHLVCLTLSGLDLALRSRDEPESHSARWARLDLALADFLAALPASTSVVISATSPSDPTDDSTSSAFVSLAGPAFAPEATGLILQPVELAPTLLAALGFPSSDDRSPPVRELLAPRLQPSRDFRIATYGERSLDHPRDYSEESRHLRALETLGYIRTSRETPPPRDEPEEKPK